MNQSEITESTRRGLRDPRFSETEIAAMTLLGVQKFGNTIKMVAPSYFRGRSISTSYTHIFDWPSDCQSVLNVFDAMTNSTAITAATAASPISITATAHGLAEDDIVLITGVLGNTDANGTFKITYDDANTVTLDGSTGATAYTSGGQIIKLSSSFSKMTKKEAWDQNLTSRNGWYPEGKKIIIDYLSFTNDIIVDYIKRPDAIDDIPEEYHMGLVGWNVTRLLKVPQPDSKDYQDLVNSFASNKELYNSTLKSIEATFLSNTEPNEIYDVERWNII